MPDAATPGVVYHGETREMNADRLGKPVVPIGLPIFLYLLPFFAMLKEKDWGMTE